MMSGGVRVPAFAALLWALAPIAGRAQYIEAYPHQITFQFTAYTLIPPERPPAQFIGIAPGPLGIDKVPFRLREIRPTNLPTGVATNFVIVSPSAGVAATQLSGLPHVCPVIALNPKVVPYMRHGIYNVLVVFENPDNPAAGATGVDVYLYLNLPGFPEIASVVNSASMRPGISPGQLVTIRGSHLSSPPVLGEADSRGLFPTVIGSTRVTFNGIPAPLLYVSNEQINCVVPQGIAGSKTAQVVVDLLSPSGLTDSSPAVAVPVSDTSPGIFTADQSGSGPGAILNAGAGTGYNTESNPAPQGSAVTFYATGAGAWNVAYPDGSLVLASQTALPPPNPEFLAPLAAVSVTIGGKPARVVAATAQPMRVSGMLQVTAEIPEGIGSGAQPVVLKVGQNDNAQQNVTVWVK
jgi:uncharacterized protein (TIGR03437 family)